MKIAEIKNLLPHRYPFLLIDRVLELGPNKIKCLKNVTVNEEFFNGHFPREPIMPGVLQVEALAQAGCLLYIDEHKINPEDYTVVFSAINNCKFRRPVVPGDQLILEVEITGIKRQFITMRSVASVDGQVTCQLDATAALIPNDK
ncbi:MAG: 3-hydroxyacyl-ACP dehydratase FabZ [Bacteroidetes bacterium]|nr:3-hydroxyacyl-ACP dehydratase FabZ [Bacteroidota bacterium]MCH8522982.1 3-hydroxyacyl-ACP dehydratase FabZ [Balneolales bacterium]